MNTSDYLKVRNQTIDSAIEVVRGLLRDEGSALDYAQCDQVQQALHGMKTIDTVLTVNEEEHPVVCTEECVNYNLDTGYTVVSNAHWDTKVEFDIYKHVSYLQGAGTMGGLIKIPVYGVDAGTFEPIIEHREVKPFMHGVVHFNGKSSWSFCSKEYEYANSEEINNISTVMRNCLTWAERLLSSSI